MKKNPTVLRNSGFPAFFRAMLALCMALSCAGAALAQTHTLTIQSFKSEIAITPDGMVDVTETIQAHFAWAWHGLYRTVPVQYTTPQGLNFTLDVEPVSITDDSGTNLKYETSTANGYLKFKIYVPDAVNAT